MFERLKAKIDRDNEKMLDGMPLHERDQILEASKTYRGTLRYLWNSRFGRR